MAVGDFTITSSTLRRTGNASKINGTLEVNSTGTTSAIFPNSRIISFSFDRNLDDRDIALPRAHINAIDFNDDVNSELSGSVHVQASQTAPDTLVWTAEFI
jgi:hypothetical protein